MRNWTARVGRGRFEIRSLDELRSVLAPTAGAADEVWLEHPDGSRMCMLRNGGRAVLMYQTGDDDPGLLGRARDEPVTSGTARFTLSNGQRDEYPVSQTVAADDAVASLEHFFATGGLTPRLDWAPTP